MMNVADLIGAAPDLLEGLKGLGLDDAQIDTLGSEVGRQLLGGRGGSDVAGLLAGLNFVDFLGRMDVPALARGVGISAETAEAALALIAPKVEAFSGEGIAGRLGSLASGLFGRRD